MMSHRGKRPTKYYSNGRVKRGPVPVGVITRTKYRKASLPSLRRDFVDRCAYCMRHISTETEMHVDHFDPRHKNDKIQVYSNLFLSDAHCKKANFNDNAFVDCTYGRIESKDDINFIRFPLLMPEREPQTYGMMNCEGKA